MASSPDITIVKTAAFYWLIASMVILLLVAIVVSYQLNIPFGDLSRDPLTITGGHPLLGMISNIGIIFWSFSAATCIFTYSILKAVNCRDEYLGFIAYSGMISLMMLLDDLFMLHERIYPTYLGIGEVKGIVVVASYLVYALLIMFYLYKYKKIILEQTEYILLLIALISFSISIFVDLVPKSLLYSLFTEDYKQWHHLFEDGPKFIGIVTWFTYQFSICLNVVGMRLSQAES